MWEDPIVAEVHRTREKLAAEYNFDVTAFFADLRKRQAALGSRLVPPKKVEPTAEVKRNHGLAPPLGSTLAQAGPAT